MSRIHDALRRAEEELRSRGRAAPDRGSRLEDQDSDQEILEILRVTEGAENSSVDISAAPLPVEAAPASEPDALLETFTASIPPATEPFIAQAPVAPALDTPQPLPPPARSRTWAAAAPDTLAADPASALPTSVPKPAADAPVPRPEVVEVRPAARLSPAPEDTPISIEDLVARCRSVDWKPDSARMLSFDIRNSNPVGLEEFRTLRSRLYQLRSRQTLSRVLVTSALPGEGKTFVSANLAQVMVRQRNRRALLIDCDLRISRLHEALGAPSSPGVTDYLRGDADEFAIVQKGSLENLFFIPGGRPASNPSDLLAGNRLARLLDRLSPLFDWVILDTPPAVPIADASVIAGLCHGVLIVVSSGNTPFDLAQKACREFRQSALLGTVLNRVPRGATYSRYYYSAYESGDTKG
jgi:capsular exopolysaccharide synthesis family protein